jgi:REP element-mobilizing transposase RayT
MMIAIPPKFSVSQVIGFIKGRSAGDQRQDQLKPG